MTLKEMRTCAAETLDYFIKVMPRAPFAADDIIIEFAPKNKMAERAKALCALYVPDKILNIDQEIDIENNVRANALIGKEKSAVIVRIDYTLSTPEFRTMMFHEFTHIFCAKLEMEGKEHFIDIYGSGTTPGTDVSPEDGLLCSGYEIWSEFIANYYALLWTWFPKVPLSRISDYINHLIEGVKATDLKTSKRNLSMACAYFMDCSDAEKEIALFREEFDDEMPIMQKAFLNCLFHLHENLKTEKPWEITEDFISQLGFKYTMLIAYNSFSGRLTGGEVGL